MANKDSLTVRDIAMYLGSRVYTPRGIGRVIDIGAWTDHVPVVYPGGRREIEPVSDIKLVLKEWPWSERQMFYRSDFLDLIRSGQDAFGFIGRGLAVTEEMLAAIGWSEDGWLTMRRSNDFVTKDSK